jgi:hypothetical protein
MEMAHITFVKQRCMFLVHKGEAVHPFAEQNRSSTSSLQKRSAPKDAGHETGGRSGGGINRQRPIKA